MINFSNMKTRLNAIIDSEWLDHLNNGLLWKKATRKTSRKPKDGSTPFLKGKQIEMDAQKYRGNIERFYGLAQVPVGLAGPIKVNGVFARDCFMVPMATTEGALVASYNRGAKVISVSGGANVFCLSECMTRTPGFVFGSAMNATRFVAWAKENMGTFKSIVRTTTSHGHLEECEATINGRYVWVTFKFVTGDASGQNMVTMATDAICRFIENHAPLKPQQWYIDANLSGDKKASRSSFQTGRGKNMTAEVTIPKDVVGSILHTTPQRMVDFHKIAMLGGIQSGSIGVQGHFANALAAIFIACGQDAACVAESAVGTTNAELDQNGDLYVSVSMPNLVVGTVGGGTHLPTQRECLEILECYGQDKSKKFAEICCATVLAGEISIAAAMSAGHFTRAHKRLGRKKPAAKKNLLISA